MSGLTFVVEKSQYVQSSACSIVTKVTILLLQTFIVLNDKTQTRYLRREDIKHVRIHLTFLVRKLLSCN